MDHLDWEEPNFPSLHTRVARDLGFTGGPNVTPEVAQQEAIIAYLMTQIELGYEHCEIKLVRHFWPRSEAEEERFRIIPTNQRWNFQVQLERGYEGKICYALPNGRSAVIRLPEYLTQRLLDDCENFFWRE